MTAMPENGPSARSADAHMEVNMPRYRVSYSTSTEFTVDIDAESEDAAEAAVLRDGKDADGVYSWDEESSGFDNKVHEVVLVDEEEEA